jgi:broad specificity phosphatase PhoE
VSAPSPDVVVYLVRHGRTRLNAAGLLRGHLDEPLDDEGRHQAERLAQAFNSVEIAAVVTSPLLRARETAQAIASISGAPLTVEPRLISRDYRDWAGRTESRLRDRYSTIDAAPDIEPLDTFTSRITGALDGLADSFNDQRVVVVAHDAVIRHLLASLVPTIGVDPAAIPQRPGCWNRLERSNARWTAPVVDAIPDEGPRP